MRRDVLAAAALGAVVSGAPSTLDAWRRDGAGVLDAALAAGAIVAGDDAPAAVRLAVAVPVHAAISLLWAVVLERALPPRHGAAWGAVGGLAIAALDLGVVGRRLEPIRRLPLAGQVADHVLFGAVTGWALRGRRMTIRRPG